MKNNHEKTQGTIFLASLYICNMKHEKDLEYFDLVQTKP